jgi:hypothetical protein
MPCTWTFVLDCSCHRQSSIVNANCQTLTTEASDDIPRCHDDIVSYSLTKLSYIILLSIYHSLLFDCSAFLCVAVAEIHFFRWGGAKPPKFPTKLSNFRHNPPFALEKTVFSPLLGQNFLKFVNFPWRGGAAAPPPHQDFRHWCVVYCIVIYSTMCPYFLYCCEGDALHGS